MFFEMSLAQNYLWILFQLYFLFIFLSGSINIKISSDPFWEINFCSYLKVIPLRVFFSSSI